MPGVETNQAPTVVGSVITNTLTILHTWVIRFLYVLLVAAGLNGQR